MEIHIAWLIPTFILAFIIGGIMVARAGVVDELKLTHEKPPTALMTKDQAWDELGLCHTEMLLGSSVVTCTACEHPKCGSGYCVQHCSERCNAKCIPRPGWNILAGGS